MIHPLAAALLLSAGAPAPGEPAAAPRPGPTVELGGTLSAVAAEGLGALDAFELPRAAVRPAGERTFSISVRQSRLHAAVALPPLDLLCGAAARARVEVDFAGPTSDARALPQPRLREAWAEARLPGPRRVTLLAGQAGGLFAGPNLAESVTRLALPRFSGAGQLDHRAPQLRLSFSALPGPLELELSAALLAPLDPSTAVVPSAANPTPVGVRAGLPDAQGRAALAWRVGEGHGLLLGLSGHTGRQRYRLDGLVGQPDGGVDSWGGAVDLLVEGHGLALQAAAWGGRNLGALGTGLPGATLWTDASSGRLLAVSGVWVQGGWAQLRWRALPVLTVVAGGGQEAADRAGLAAGDFRWKSGQLSGGLIAELGGGWRAGLEGTGFWTRTTAAGRASSAQVELGLMVGF